MTESTRNIAVGLTTLAGLGGLIVLMLMFGYLPEMFESGYKVTIKMPTAAGIKPGNRVLYQGLDVGEVRDIEQAPGLAGGVRIHVLVRDDKQIPKGATVEVSRPALGGSPTISFVAPTDVASDQLSALPRDGSAEVTGRVSSPFSQLADALQNSVDSLMGELKGDDGALANIGRLARTWDTLGQNLVTLTDNKPTLDQVDAGEADVTVGTFLARMDQIVRDLNVAVDGVNSYLQDEQLRENLTTTFENTSRISSQIAGWTGKLDTTTDHLDSAIGELKTAYVNVADQLGSFITSGTRLVERAEQGDGTVGQLINNPQLYENLNDAAQRLDAALEEAQLLIEKWKAEGVPIQL